MRVSTSGHLVALVADADAAAARITAADPDLRRMLADRSRRRAARLSARLDGSPLDDATADAVDAREAAGEPLVAAADLERHRAPAADGRQGGWAQALRLDAMETDEVAAVEYANLLTASDAEPELAAVLLERPAGALEALHHLLVRGLVDPDVAGRPRRTDQAVHDGAQGMVLYHTPPPEALPGLLDDLATWLGGGVPAGWPPAADLPALVVAGVVHQRLLQWQPFEAANGRLARAAARLVLRARGLDPHGVAVPETYLAADPVGYYAEVAATMRRRDDLGLWLERSGEATVSALEDAARTLAPDHAGADPATANGEGGGTHQDDSATHLDEDGTVTVADFAARAGIGRDRAGERLRALARDGVLVRVPGSRGLRYRRR